MVVGAMKRLEGADGRGLSEGLPMGGCREGYGGSICEGKGATPTKG